MPQIEYKNVTKEYEPEKKVLDNVSFKVEKGEFVFLVGPSGAGKSTLVKLLIREELPTEGQIIFSELTVPVISEEAGKGEKVSIAAEEVAANIPDLPYERLPELRRKIGVVFQDFKVLKSKNCFENISVALEVVGMTENEINEMVPNILGLVGLSDKQESFPKELSGGEIQRLSIARALSHEPEVLVADEPTGMIDPQSTDEVLKVFEKINSLGTTVIIATHDTTVVDRMKKRVIRLVHGKVISDQSEGKYHG